MRHHFENVWQSMPASQNNFATEPRHDRRQALFLRMLQADRLCLSFDPGQDLTPHLEALRSAGCERTSPDKASGAKADRAGLADALSYARIGDVLVV